MTNTLKNGLLVVSLMVSAALGAAALAGAASNGSTTTTTQAPSTQPPARDWAGAPPHMNGLPPQRSDETLLTGDTAARVKEAALGAVSGGTIERVETDADGHAKYEAHMKKADGSQVTVYVNDQFQVVSTQAGP